MRRRRLGLITLAFVGACADSLAVATYDGPDAATPDGGDDASVLAPDVDGAKPNDAGSSTDAPPTCTGFDEAWADASAWQRQGDTPPTPMLSGDNEVTIAVPASMTSYLSHSLPPCNFTLTFTIGYTGTEPNAPSDLEMLALRQTNGAVVDFFLIGYGGATKVGQWGLAIPTSTSPLLEVVTGDTLTLTFSTGRLNVTSTSATSPVTLEADRFNEIDLGAAAVAEAGSGAPQSFTYGAIDVDAATADP